MSKREKEEKLPPNKDNNLILEPGMTQKQFLKLQKEWYKKAEASGFEDIESTLPDGSSSNLTKSAPGVQGRRHTELHIESNREYYSNASAFLWHKDWSDPIEKRIWELHSDGKSYRDIIQDLKSIRPIGLNTITQIVNRLKEEMKVWAIQEQAEAQAEEDEELEFISNTRLSKNKGT